MARAFGAAAGSRGWRVMTGGYGGLMGAAAQGAAQEGARAIGLPMRAWTQLRPSSWCSELRWSDNYPERLGHLLSCDAVVALDGGIGTLAETTAVWSALQTEPGATQLVLLGAGWPGLLTAFAAELVIDAADLALAPVVRGPEEAAELLESLLSSVSRARPNPRG